MNSLPRCRTPHKTKQGKDQRGFTLIELLMVLAIIAALSAIMIPVYNHYVDKAKITVAVGTLDSVRKNLENYYIDYQEYPPPPIDFNTGKDGATPSRNVFSVMLLQQINKDLASIVSYNTTGIGYALVVKARDKNQTTITLNPNNITY